MRFAAILAIATLFAAGAVAGLSVSSEPTVQTATFTNVVTYTVPTVTETTTVTTTTTTTPPAASAWLNDVGEFGRLARDWSVSSNWHSDSARLVALLKSKATSAILTVGSYGVAEYRASAADPLMTVRNLNGWGNKPTGGSFRCPSAAKPATGSDAHIVCVQPDGSIWEMWKAVRTSPTTWDAGSVSSGPAGTYTYPIAGSRGSSFTLASGALTPEEISAGRITHALAAVLPSAAVRRAYMWPSNDTDGVNADGIPEGARIVLDPAADLSSLSGVTKLVARAWQEYGFFVVDKTSGSDLSFIAIAPQSWTALGSPDPWAAQGITGYPNVGALLALIPQTRIENQPITVKP